MKAEMTEDERFKALEGVSGGARVEPPRVSPYSVKARVGRVLWSLVSWLVWRRTPRWCNGLRVGLLRLFGARVGRGVVVDSSVVVEIPWNLTLGEGVRVCERAMLYCLGPVRIGARTFVGPFVHVCAGTHDYTDPRFTLVRSPIEIGEDCVLLTASFVGPGVRVASGGVLRPRAGVFQDTEANTIYGGNPARACGERGGG